MKSLPDIESFPVRSNIVNTQNVDARVRKKDTQSGRGSIPIRGQMALGQ